MKGQQTQALRSCEPEPLRDCSALPVPPVRRAAHVNCSVFFTKQKKNQKIIYRALRFESNGFSARALAMRIALAVRRGGGERGKIWGFGSPC